MLVVALLNCLSHFISPLCFTTGK